jgi:hypothetical protein
MPRVHLVNPSTQSFGVASDTPSTCDATVALAEQANLTFAQFVLLTPFGHRRFRQVGGRRE